MMSRDCSLASDLVKALFNTHLLSFNSLVKANRVNRVSITIDY